jgi:hypothetical protein
VAVTGLAVADPVTAAIAKTDIVSMRFMGFSLQSVIDETAADCLRRQEAAPYTT